MRTVPLMAFLVAVASPVLADTDLLSAYRIVLSNDATYLAARASAEADREEVPKAGSWDTEIKTRVAGGNPPDVGLFPQPGVMCDLAKQGKVLAYDDATVTSAKATLVNGFVGAGTRGNVTP